MTNFDPEVTYVYERVIDGAETGVEGVYNGTDITYSVSGIAVLAEIAPNESLTFTLKVNGPWGVKTNAYVLRFNFLPKGSVEVLPDGTKYEVVFKPNNGNADTIVTVDKEKTVPRPADPTRSGYTSTGWYKNIDCLVPWHFDTDTVTVSTMLHAGWRDNSAGSGSDLL